MLKFEEINSDFNKEVLKFVKISSDFSREVLKFVKINSDFNREVLTFQNFTYQKAWVFDDDHAQVMVFARVIFRNVRQPC